MQYILVPVIMFCAVIGTVGALKIIRKFFPGVWDVAEKAKEWADKHDAGE